MKKVIDIFAQKEVRDQRIRVSQAPKEAVYLAYQNAKYPTYYSEIKDLRHLEYLMDTKGWVDKDTEIVICVEKGLIEQRTVAGDPLSLRLAMNLESRNIFCWQREVVGGEERSVPWVKGRIAIKAAHIWDSFPKWARKLKVILVDRKDPYVDSEGYHQRKGKLVSYLTFASGSPSMVRAGNFYALNPNVWKIEEYCGAIGFDLANFKLRFDTVDFGNDAIKALSRQYLAGSSGHMHIAFGKTVLKPNGGNTYSKEVFELTDGQKAIHYTSPAGVVVGVYPDGEVILSKEEVIVNQTRTYSDIQTRAEKILEDGLVPYTLHDFRNNYTDGQGFVDADVWHELFPSAKRGTVTGRMGTVVKGLFIRIKGLKKRFGVDVMLLDGQVKSKPAFENEFDNGWAFCTTRILNVPEWLSETNISNVSLQYLHEDWNNEDVREALLKGTHETYRKLIELDPQALLDRLGRDIEGEDSEDQDNAPSVDYDKLLGRIIRELGGKVKGFSVYESRVKNLVRSMTEKVSNMEHFMVEGVVDYLMAGDPLLYLNGLDKLGKTVLTEDEARKVGAVGRDEIVTAVKDEKGPKFLTGFVSLLRTPCSSRLSVRRVKAVAHKGYLKAFSAGMFEGLQIRSAMDLNTSCQDGADFDGDRCKIITPEKYQFLDTNPVYKIDGWIKNGEFHDKCPY